LECVEARDAGAAALDDEQLERALREALRGDTVALVAVLQEEARRRFPPPMMGLPAALMTKLLERQRPPRTGSGRGSVLPWRGLPAEHPARDQSGQDRRVQKAAVHLVAPHFLGRQCERAQRRAGAALDL
jgi:hypothetical protein